jgi:hypothetical protein
MSGSFRRLSGAIPSDRLSAGSPLTSPEQKLEHLKELVASLDELAQASPELLKARLRAIIDSIVVTDGKIITINFHCLDDTTEPRISIGCNIIQIATTTNRNATPIHGSAARRASLRE